LPTRDSNQFDPKDDKRTAADEVLDHLLNSADWPETPPLVLARLEKQWRGISPSTLARRRRRRLWVAAAAGLLLTAGLYVLWPAGEHPLEPRIAVQEDDEQPPVDLPRHVDNDSIESPNNAEDESESPKKKTRQRRPRTRRQWLAYRKDLDSSVQKAIAQLAANTEWTHQQVATALEPLHREREYCMGRLVRQVTSQKNLARHAAFDLLVALAGEKFDLEPLLTQLAAVPGCHDLAMRELAPRCDSEVLAAYTLRETDRVLQQYMLQQLLKRKDVRSVGAYLDLVADMKTRQPALQTLRQADATPTVVLLGYLQRGNRTRSLAAVLALAELNDPQVVQQLGRLVLANVDRQAALMTLMARSDPQSVSFLRQLARIPAFTGDLVSARNRLATVVMVNTIVMQEI
jgi:hypothetical protein